MPRAPAIEDLPTDLQIRTLKVAADSGLEWMTGYGVWSLQFQSGDLLALRCFPSAGLGGFVTLWHQTPDLTWHMYVASETPESACPRYFGAVVTSAEQADVAIMTECGLDPGIDLVLYARAARQFDTITAIDSYCGGIPEPKAMAKPETSSIRSTSSNPALANAARYCAVVRRLNRPSSI